MAKAKNQTISGEENEEVLLREPSLEGAGLEGFSVVEVGTGDIAEVFEDEVIPLEEEIVPPEEDGMEEEGFADFLTEDDEY